MKLRNGIVTAVLAAGFTLAATASEARVDVDVNLAPPPPRYEVVPAPRAGYVWAPGYWDYVGNHHVWRKGHWVAERHGYRYAPHHWVQHDGRWRMEGGHWEH